MKATEHKHRKARESRERCYTGPVAEYENQVPEAHGGVAWTEFCKCGAEREILSNMCFVELGDWAKTEDER